MLEEMYKLNLIRALKEKTKEFRILLSKDNERNYERPGSYHDYASFVCLKYGLNIVFEKTKGGTDLNYDVKINRIDNFENIATAYLKPLDLYPGGFEKPFAEECVFIKDNKLVFCIRMGVISCQGDGRLITRDESNKILLEYDLENNSVVSLKYIYAEKECVKARLRTKRYVFCTLTESFRSELQSIFDSNAHKGTYQKRVSDRFRELLNHTAHANEGDTTTFLWLIEEIQKKI